MSKARGASPMSSWHAVRAAAFAAVVLLFGIAALATAAAPQAPRDAQVDAVFAEWDQVGSPGCALGVVEDGDLTYERGYGSAQLDWAIPAATDVVFYVGSVSKQFTAATTALMAQEGLISLDDDIRQYFPEMPEYQRPITVRHLVHHTSGLRDIYTLMALAGIRIEDVFSDDDAIALIAAQRETNFPPGDEYLYSNSGYFLLAQLVERASGKTLREYAEEKIFAPLGMNDTHFHDQPRHIVERRAMSYGRQGNGPFVQTYLGNFDKVGAGGLYSTVQDLLLWDRNFYTGDVGGDEFLELIQTPGSLHGGQPITYAFGLSIDDYRGLSTVSHSGSMMGFKAAFLQFPEQRFSVLVTCNLGSIDAMGLARDVADLYLAEALDAPVDAAQPGPRAGNGEVVAFEAAEIEAFSGVFRSDELDVDYVFRSDDGRTLWLQVGDMTPRRVIKDADGALRTGGWRIHPEQNAGSAMTAFTVDAGRVTNIRFVRR